MPKYTDQYVSQPYDKMGRVKEKSSLNNSGSIDEKAADLMIDNRFEFVAIDSSQVLQFFYVEQKLTNSTVEFARESEFLNRFLKYFFTFSIVYLFTYYGTKRK